MNEFGVGKLCEAHYIELKKKVGDVETYTINLTFNDHLFCSRLGCDKPPTNLVTIPKEERSNYGKKAKSVR